MDKRVVSREVMSGRASVDSSWQFGTVAADNCKETKIMHIAKEEIEATKLKLEEQFNGANAIPHDKSKLLDSALAIQNTFINKTVQERDDHNVNNCDHIKQQTDEVHSDNTIVASDVEDDTLITSITTMPRMQHPHTRHTPSLQLHPHTHHTVSVTPGFVDIPRWIDGAVGQMER